MNTQEWNTQVWKNSKIFILTLLVLISTSLSSNTVQLGYPNFTSSGTIESIGRPTGHTSVGLIKSSIISITKLLSKTASFGFRNYDKILSKKFLAALIIAGAPYLYFTDTDVLEIISQHASDFTFRMSGAVCDGIIMSIIHNPTAISKIITLMTVGQTSKKMAEIVGKKLAETLITLISFGAIS